MHITVQTFRAVCVRLDDVWLQVWRNVFSRLLTHSSVWRDEPFHLIVIVLDGIRSLSLPLSSILFISLSLTDECETLFAIANIYK